MRQRILDIVSTSSRAHTNSVTIRRLLNVLFNSGYDVKVPEFCITATIKELNSMEQDRLVILHRDSSAGQRHAQEFGGITLVCLRPQESI